MRKAILLTANAIYSFFSNRLQRIVLRRDVHTVRWHNDVYRPTVVIPPYVSMGGVFSLLTMCFFVCHFLYIRLRIS